MCVTDWESVRLTRVSEKWSLQDLHVCQRLGDCKTYTCEKWSLKDLHVCQ